MSKVVGMVVLEVPPTLKVGIIKYLRKYRIRGGGRVWVWGLVIVYKSNDEVGGVEKKILLTIFRKSF